MHTGLAEKIRNLVVRADFNVWSKVNLEQWLVKDVLGVFPGVKELVVADQLHNVDESAEGFVWALGQPSATGICDSDDAEMPRECFANLLLWKDANQYEQCKRVNELLFNEEWNKNLVGGAKKDRTIPHLSNGSIVSSSIKRQIMEICGGQERDVLQLEGLDWGFIAGDHDYTGSLDLEKQIDYIILTLSRDFTDGEGDEVREGLREDIPGLIARRDVLMGQLELREMVVTEAENIVY